MKYIALCSLWIVWCFQHSFFTTTKVTTWFKNRLGDKFAFYRIFYNLISLATVLPLLYWQNQIPGTVVIRLSPLLLVFKYIGLASGVLIVAGSFFTFDVLEFTGIKQASIPREKPGGTPVIRKHGLYSIIRHPMYLGGLIYCISSMTDVPPARFLGFFILAAYMVIGAGREDRRLAGELGEIYINYQKEVPMLLPKIFKQGK